MRVAQITDALATREPDEEVIVHVTMRDGAIMVCDLKAHTEIGPGEGFVLIVSQCAPVGRA